jgi:integrase/recombinase XerD
MSKLPTCITEDELLKVLGDVRVKRHHKFAFALAFYECLRVSEAVKLRLDDIDFSVKTIKIVQGKGGKDRVIPIAPEIFHKGIKTYIPLRCGVRALEIAFKQACKRILGKDYHFHILRHGGVSHYINQKKWSSLQVQRMAGHSKVQTTEIYTHVRPEDLVNRMWGEKE